MQPETVERVAVPGMAEPPGASWSNCLRIGQEIVVSGVTARGGDGSIAGGDSMGGQAQAVMAKLEDMLKAAGGGSHNVYKLVIYVTDMTRKEEVNAARKAAFSDLYPCSTLVEVTGFAFPGLLIEVDAFASLGIDMRQAAKSER